ncbi:hypothetical protein [Streptomyces sp. NPDC001480]|uniref:hypothetical protein n=1 Tax=Streptomyces sp. NPDC001480 TaxID=3364577 RepID=UPI00368B8F84
MESPAATATNLGLLWAVIEAEARHERHRALSEVIGQDEKAERLLRQAGEAGDTGALMALAGTRRDAGDHAAAERLYRQAAEVGDPGALTALADMRRNAGDHEEAERLYRHAVDAGDFTALTDLVIMRTEQGDFAQAEALAESIPNVSQRSSSLTLLSERLRDIGDVEAAEAVARKARALEEQPNAIWAPRQPEHRRHATVSEALADQDGLEHRLVALEAKLDLLLERTALPKS